MTEAEIHEVLYCLEILKMTPAEVAIHITPSNPPPLPEYLDFMTMFIADGWKNVQTYLSEGKAERPLTISYPREARGNR